MYGKRIISDFEHYLIDLLIDPQSCCKINFEFKIKGTVNFVFIYHLKEYDRYHNLIYETNIIFEDNKLTSFEHENDIIFEDEKKKEIENQFNECLLNTYAHIIRHKMKLIPY